MVKFLQGILLAVVGLPLIDSIMSIVAQVTEFICTKIAVKSALEKQKIPLEEENSYQQTHAIGFQVDTKEEEEYDDEE